MRDMLGVFMFKSWQNYYWVFFMVGLMTQCTPQESSKDKEAPLETPNTEMLFAPL